jgi:hypothetical protein
MRVLIAHNDEQLVRLESSIAALKSRSTAEQHRMSVLLAALEREKAAVLAYYRGHRKEVVGPLIAA